MDEFEKERARRADRAKNGNGSMRKARAELARRIEERRRLREEEKEARL